MLCLDAVVVSSRLTVQLLHSTSALCQHNATPLVLLKAKLAVLESHPESICHVFLSSHDLSRSDPQYINGVHKDNLLCRCACNGAHNGEAAWAVTQHGAVVAPLF